MSNLSLYVTRESGLHSLHPLTKSLMVFCVFVAGFVLPGKWISYVIFTGIVLPLALWGRVFWDLLKIVWKITWPLALSVVIIQSLFWGSGTPLFEVGILAPKK